MGFGKLNKGHAFAAAGWQHLYLHLYASVLTRVPSSPHEVRGASRDRVRLWPAEAMRSAAKKAGLVPAVEEAVPTEGFSPESFPRVSTPPHTCFPDCGFPKHYRGNAGDGTRKDEAKTIASANCIHSLI